MFDAWAVLPNFLICYNALMTIYGRMHYFSTEDFTLSIFEFFGMSVFLLAKKAFLYAFLFVIVSFFLTSEHTECLLG